MRLNQKVQSDVKIKGYVKYFDGSVGLTWEDEQVKGKYIEKPRKVIEKNGQLFIDRRVFDMKVYKEEIYFEKPTHF